MKKTIYKNGTVFIGNRFVKTDFVVENGKFLAVGSTGSGSVGSAGCESVGSTGSGSVERFEGDGIVDLSGRLVIPGLVDVHTHGSMGADFSDGDYDGLCSMAQYLAKSGVTSFAPAGMTLPYETLDKAFKCGKRLHDEMPSGHARLMGIHMEGPFFSEKKKGAQNGAYLRNPDIDAFMKLQESCGGLIRIVDIAPELPGSVAFAEAASKVSTVSLAHTDASYEEAKAAIEAGASHLTHLYNAMPPIHHRKPGVIGAGSEADGKCTGGESAAGAADSNITAGTAGTADSKGTAGTAGCKPVIAELICDGYHIHPSSIRMAFRLFPGRICLISDSLRCCGMPPGKYELGGQDVFLEAGQPARLEDGTIAGSASNVYTCMLNAISYGIPREEAILAATKIPAGEIGAADMIGAIEPGKYADFVVCDEELAPFEVYVGGVAVA